MALDGVEFSIREGPEWERVQAALDDVSTTLGRKIADAVDKAVDPWVAEAEANVATTPIKGVGKQTGLRQDVAHSVVEKETSRGDGNFDINVTSSLPHGVGAENEAIIPLGFDRDTGWSHPVFGNRDVWVQQIPLRHGWFSGTFDNRGDDITNVIQNALDEARDSIARAGA
jgi:hypothetical protein